MKIFMDYMDPPQRAFVVFDQIRLVIHGCHFINFHNEIISRIIFNHFAILRKIITKSHFHDLLTFISNEPVPGILSGSGTMPYAKSNCVIALGKD